MAEVPFNPAPPAPVPREWSVLSVLRLAGKESPLLVALVALTKIADIVELVRTWLLSHYSAEIVRWLLLVMGAAIPLACGYFLFRLACHFLLGRQSRWAGTIRIMTGCVLLLATSGVLRRCIALVNGTFPPPRPESSIVEIAQKWATQLFDTQKDSASQGGFSTAQNGNGGGDVWTTAQSLNAVLRGPFHTGKAQNVRTAFDYIESSPQRVSLPNGLPDRRPGGSGWLTQLGYKWPRTEITAWVALAYLASLRAGDIWPSADVPRVRDRVISLLDDIVSRQNASPTNAYPAGGWGPTTLKLPDSDRTYSETMALWSLVEARRTSPVAEAVGSRYDDAITNGITAVLRVREPRGWPQRQGSSELHKGLTAQTLYVLSLAAADPSLFKQVDMTGFHEARAKFLDTLKPPDYDAIARASGDDQKIRDATGKAIEEPFYVTFFEYPWTLALLSVVETDPAVPYPVRDKATETIAELEKQLHSQEAEAYFRTVDTYQLAETLIGLGSVVKR